MPEPKVVPPTRLFQIEIVEKMTPAGVEPSAPLKIETQGFALAALYGDRIAFGDDKTESLIQGVRQGMNEVEILTAIEALLSMVTEPTVIGAVYALTRERWHQEHKQAAVMDLLTRRLSTAAVVENVVKAKQRQAGQDAATLAQIPTTEKTIPPTSPLNN